MQSTRKAGNGGRCGLQAPATAATLALLQATPGLFDLCFRHAVAAGPLFGGCRTIELDGLADSRTGQAAQQRNRMPLRSIFFTVGRGAEGAEDECEAEDRCFHETTERHRSP